MLRFVNVLFICLFISFGMDLVSKEDNSREYLKYVKEITHSFVEEIQKKYPLYCSGSGGSMPNDVQEIEVLFISPKSCDVEGTREMMVDCIEILMNKINTHEKIRPYLREYPFDERRASISISFITPKGGHPVDGSIAFAYNAKDKIFYDIAEMRETKPHSFAYQNKKKEWITGVFPSKLEEELVSFHEETFKDAAKIVHGTAKAK